MLTGAHIVVYSKDAEADRAFFKDTLGFRWVDAGHHWLIFAVPAAEVAFHPHDQNNRHEMFFTCDDINAQVARCKRKVYRWTRFLKSRGGLARQYRSQAVVPSDYMNRNTPSRLEGISRKGKRDRKVGE